MNDMTRMLKRQPSGDFVRRHITQRPMKPAKPCRQGCLPRHTQKWHNLTVDDRHHYWEPGDPALAWPRFQHWYGHLLFALMVLAIGAGLPIFAVLANR